MFIKPNEPNVTMLFFAIFAMGYAVTYVFEWGYFTFFGLPSSFIELNLTMIIKNVLFITGLVSLFYILNYFISRLFHWLFSKKEFSSHKQAVSAPKKKKGVFSLIIGLLFTAALLFFFIYQAISEPEKFYYIYLSLVLIVVFYQFLTKPYLILSFVVFILFFIALVYCFGYNSASTQVAYLKVTKAAETVQNAKKEDAEELVVIRYFGNKAITAEADFQKNVLYSNYQLIEIESGNTKFETVHTGRLKVKMPNTARD